MIPVFFSILIFLMPGDLLAGQYIWTEVERTVAVGDVCLGNMLLNLGVFI